MILSTFAAKQKRRANGDSKGRHYEAPSGTLDARFGPASEAPRSAWLLLLLLGRSRFETRRIERGT